MKKKKTKKKPRGKKKGNGFERKILKGLCEAFKEHGIGIHDASRSSLSGGLPDSYGDISMSARLATLFPFAIECKFHQKVNLNFLYSPYNEMSKSCWFKSWWKQTLEGAAKCNRSPLLIFKTNGEQELCAFDWPRLKISSTLNALQLKIFHRLKSCNRMYVHVKNKKVCLMKYKDFLKIIAEETFNASEDRMAIVGKTAKTTSRSKRSA